MVGCNESPWICCLAIDCHQNLLTEFGHLSPFCIVYRRVCQRHVQIVQGLSLTITCTCIKEEGRAQYKQAQIHIYGIRVRPDHFQETQLKVGSMDTSQKCKKHFHELITHSNYKASHL